MLHNWHHHHHHHNRYSSCSCVQANSSVEPQLWQPASGILMTNEIDDTNTDEAIHCFALSKNDSYVMSASGGKISLFNMMTFKVKYKYDFFYCFVPFFCYK